MFKSLSIIFFLLSMLNIYSQNLTINAEGKMIVGEGVKVTVEGNLVLKGPESLEIKNSSFIVNGTSSGSGKMTYIKTIPQGSYQQISSPVVDQDVVEFIDKNPSIEAGKNEFSVNRGLYYYDYRTNKWVRNNSPDKDNNYITKFKHGQGWIVRLNGESSDNGEISFEGTFQNDNIQIGTYVEDLDHNEGLFGYIGNPYTSYIAVHKKGGDLDTFFGKNTDLLQEETVYMWDAVDRKYLLINLTSSTTDYIEPAQGFFIKPKKEIAGLSFNHSMRRHKIKSKDQEKSSSSRHKIKSTDQEKSSSSRPEIKLMITDGSSNKYTNIFYIEGTTTGFDNGYDSTIYDNGGDDFDIYTHLVSDSQGDDYGIQSLPNSDYETMVVPVGFNATSDTEIIISAAIVNFPAGISVYLEDKEDSSFTLLDNSATYTTTLSEDINGIGRFYLHTTSSVLSTDKVALNNHLSIYTSSKENIRISGVYSGVAKLRMYNILGKQVLNTSFEGNGLNDIALPKNISNGVYIVHLVTDLETVTKKILI